MDGNLKVLNDKLDALVFGTVRPIAGSLLVAGALFCLGLMSVHAQTVDLELNESFEISVGDTLEFEFQDQGCGAGYQGVWAR